MRKCIVLNILAVLAFVVVACQPQTVVVKEEVTKIVKEEVTKIVTEEKVVKETVVVKQEVTKVVEKPVEIEKIVTATPLPAAAFKESPMMTGLVERGKLPSVDQRLPVNPMVLEPLVEQGAYGGTLRFGFVGTSAAWGGMLYIAGWDHLVNWAPDYNSVLPNAVAGWDVSDDATEYTFFMRKGMKWSDGEPYTADDIVFFVDDVLGNEELFPGGVGGDWLPRELADGFYVEKIDDFTVKFVFPKPYGTFLYQIATWAGRQFTQYPAHYLTIVSAK
jgi:peptide/nickel transport system substrate-binding protein